MENTVVDDVPESDIAASDLHCDDIRFAGSVHLHVAHVGSFRHVGEIRPSTRREAEVGLFARRHPGFVLIY